MINRVFFFSIVFVTCLFALQAAQQLPPQVLGETDTLTAEQILAEVNQARAANQLPPLNVSSRLIGAAYNKGNNMITTDNFEHSYQTAEGAIEPWQFILDTGYNYSHAGENLARDFLSAQSLVKAWMDSPEHRANLLSHDYRETGIAVLTGPYFGRPQTSIVVQFLAVEAPAGAALASSPSFSATTLLIPSKNFLSLLTSTHPRYYVIVAAIAIIATTALFLDYQHHRPSTKPALKHWRKR